VLAQEWIFRLRIIYFWYSECTSSYTIYYIINFVQFLSLLFWGVDIFCSFCMHNSSFVLNVNSFKLCMIACSHMKVRISSQKFDCTLRKSYCPFHFTVYFITKFIWNCSWLQTYVSQWSYFCLGMIDVGCYWLLCQQLLI
jgi:hypothetical protein